MATRAAPMGRTRAAGLAVATRSANDRLIVFLLLPVAILLIVGLGALMSASSVIGLRDAADKLFYFKRQVMFIGIGVVAFVVAVRVPYRWYSRLAPVILLAAIAGLVATLAVGEMRGGARSWIAAGPITLQVSEFAKFAVVAFLASALTRKEGYLHRFGHVFWPVALSLGSVLLLLMLQPDLGTALLVVAAALAVLAVSAVPMRHVLLLTVTGAAAGLVMARAQPYRWRRIVSFLHPDADPLGDGLQAIQSLVALGTGRWFGVGLGASRARWFFLPNAHTDFIFAIIGEETGLAGSLIVVALLVMFAVVGVAIALRAPDMFGRLLAAGIVSWLSIQALVNVGGVTRVLPITGVPLPFVSSGGSAMIVNMAVVGILVNVARSGRRGGMASRGARS